ncbi:Y-family DNA polymerase [Rufibacter ruber]|uniref:Y-family DNA polymerase n=1 Tax=Rufibacter ruber TaxID=1783499 RepID=UPI0008374870|nr:Y-family DNA polymerase [Rufibacter ruber]
MYALVDCNNFYASCERVFNPSLRGKPIVVLSNNDGCVISRSQEAKDLGVKMGEPYFKQREWFKEQGVQVFSSNYALYGDMSRRVMMELSTFTPELEVYSIDEAFLNLKGFEKHYDLAAYAEQIRQRIKQCQGVPVCVGIGPTKTLAKAANHLAKRHKDSQGVWVIDTEEAREQALRNIPVKEIWGIGRKKAVTLEGAGVETAWKLTKRSVEWVSQYLGGVVGVRLLKELRGHACLQTVLPQEKKNIAFTRSFGKVVTCSDYLEQAVTLYASKAAEKLRQQGSVAGAITVFAHTQRYSLAEPYFKSSTIELPSATDSTLELVKAAAAGMRGIFKEGIKFGKAGVILSDLRPNQHVQIHLFQESTVLEHRGLMQALDSINTFWGNDVVKVASAGTNQQQREWQMLNQLCSPRYTTHIGEVLMVR